MSIFRRSLVVVISQSYCSRIAIEALLPHENQHLKVAVVTCRWLVPKSYCLIDVIIQFVKILCGEYKMRSSLQPIAATVAAVVVAAIGCKWSIHRVSVLALFAIDLLTVRPLFDCLII